MKKTFLPLLVGLAFCVPPTSQACTVPVFRFALERWELANYEILVYHRGPIPADVQAAIKTWSDAPAKANVEFTTIDLDGKMSAAHMKLWLQGGNKDAPVWIIVPSLANEDAKPIAWSGLGTAANVQTVLSSPTRQAILAHLARGASVVYVLLTSEDAKADEEVHGLLAKKLPILEKKIKLPVPGDDPDSKLRLPLALMLSLPLLVLDRNDEKEAGLISMLLATEDLGQVKGPIVFPIFGRGRVLGSVYKAKKQDAFPADLIDEATLFLCKECSCMVKELNPGTDLLLAANWGRIIDQMFEVKQAEPLEKRLSPVSAEMVAPAPIFAAPNPGPSIEASPTVPTPTPVTCCPSCPWLWTAVGVAGGLVIVTGGWVAYRMCMNSNDRQV